MKRQALLLFAVLFSIAAPLLVMGQPVTDPVPDPFAFPKPEMNMTLANAITGLGAVATPWIIYGVSRVLPKTPRVVLPLLPFAFGWAADQLAAYAAGGHSMIGAAGAGYLAYLTREIPNTFFAHGLTGGGGQVFPDIDRRPPGTPFMQKTTTPPPPSA